MTRARPWQNRPSLIACWEHSLVGTDLTGNSIDTLQFSKDNILTGQLPVCVPRACRFTRLCLHYVYQTSGGESFTFRFHHGPDCGSAGYNVNTIEVPAGEGNFAANCFCGDLSVPLDECDLWYADILLSGTVFPLVRANIHFELR